MGRPEQADPSQYQPESDPKPQENQYDPGTLDDVPPPIYETSYYNDDNQQESLNPPGNDPQSQQPPPPQPQYQPQNPQPQANYTTQPIQPAGYQAPQGPQTMLTQPVQYPPQHNPQPQMAVPPRNYPPQANPQAYPPQTNPQAYPPQAKPQAFPPQANPQAYPPQANPQAYPPQAKPQAFPPFRNPQVFNSQSAFQSPQAVQFPPSQAQTGYSAVQQPQFGQAGMMKDNGATIGTPVPNPYPPPATEGWSSGLFDCMDDPSNALATACFPCLTFGQIAEIVDNGHTTCGTSGLLYGVIAFMIGMPCLLSCTYRTKLRSRYGLVEAPAPDWVTHFFFEWCALCQEYRELQHRGLDPSIGWIGNVNKNQQQQLAMQPPVNQTMMG